MRQSTGSSSGSHATTRCGNEKCGTSNTTLWRRGWKIDGDSQKTVMLCNACGLHYKKGHFCSYCNQIYKESDSEDMAARWMGCDRCSRWIHKSCEERHHKGRTEKLLDSESGKEEQYYLCPGCATAEDECSKDAEALRRFREEMQYSRRKRPTAEKNKKKLSMSSTVVPPSPAAASSSSSAAAAAAAAASSKKRSARTALGEEKQRKQQQDQNSDTSELNLPPSKRSKRIAATVAAASIKSSSSSAASTRPSIKIPPRQEALPSGSSAAVPNLLSASVSTAPYYHQYSPMPSPMNYGYQFGGLRRSSYPHPYYSSSYPTSGSVASSVDMASDSSGSNRSSPIPESPDTFLAPPECVTSTLSSWNGTPIPQSAYFGQQSMMPSPRGVGGAVFNQQQQYYYNYYMQQLQYASHGHGSFYSTSGFNPLPYMSSVPGHWPTGSVAAATAAGVDARRLPVTKDEVLMRYKNQFVQAPAMQQMGLLWAVCDALLEKEGSSDEEDATAAADGVVLSEPDA